MLPATPVFALTMGDPAGIGPEIAIRALHWLMQEHENGYRVIVVGDTGILRQAAGFVGKNVLIHTIESVREFDNNAINVLQTGSLTAGGFDIGKAQGSCGEAAYSYIAKAIEMAKSGEIAGVITNPINKESLKMAGHAFPGHTEIFAEQTGTTDYSMLFLLEGVGVAHVTTHCSLRQAIELITQERVVKNIRLLHTAMKQLTGKKQPRLAVGGLNPHAGENGLFGTEEITHIAPAIKATQNEGIDVSGPYPPDTVFMRAFNGEFDGVVAMLHDHGFVALKSRDFQHGVNITIGLPIIRTSVGHGTAFDLAGSGRASDESLKTAIEAAWRMYRNREGEG